MVKKCPQCNHYISDTVTVCPHCGYTMNSIESPSTIVKDESSPDIIDNEELVSQENEAANTINYETEELQQDKKNYIPIILGCILVIGVIIGIIGFSSKDNNEPSVVLADSVIAAVDSVIEEPIICK